LSKLNKLEAKKYIKQVQHVMSELHKWIPTSPPTVDTSTLLDLADLYSSSFKSYDLVFLNNIKRTSTITAKQKIKLALIIRNASEH